MIRRTPIRRSSKAKERASQVKELDGLVRKIVFDRDQNACQRCWKRAPQVVIQAAHIKSKGRYSRLRWELLNVITLCLGCHLYWWHKSPIEAAEWLEKKYPGRADQLAVLAATARKVDLKELKIALELEVQELQR